MFCCRRSGHGSLRRSDVESPTPPLGLASRLSGLLVAAHLPTVRLRLPPPTARQPGALAQCVHRGLLWCRAWCPLQSVRDSRAASGTLIASFSRLWERIRVGCRFRRAEFSWSHVTPSQTTSAPPFPACGQPVSCSPLKLEDLLLLEFSRSHGCCCLPCKRRCPLGAHVVARRRSHETWASPCVVNRSALRPKEVASRGGEWTSCARALAETKHRRSNFGLARSRARAMPTSKLVETRRASVVAISRTRGGDARGVGESQRAERGGGRGGTVWLRRCAARRTRSSRRAPPSCRWSGSRKPRGRAPRPLPAPRRRAASSRSPAPAQLQRLVGAAPDHDADPLALLATQSTSRRELPGGHRHVASSDAHHVQSQRQLRTGYR